MKDWIARWSAMLSLLLLGYGCLKVGPDYNRPLSGFQEPEVYQHGVDATAEQGSLEVPLEKWWQEFGNPEIDRLVEKTLVNNLDIRKATAQIRELEARLRQTRADLFPAVSLEGGFQQQRQTVTNPLTGAASRRTVETGSLSIPVSYELDLWGRIARSEEAAGAELLGMAENRRTIAQSLAAEVVRLYLQMEFLERRLHINRTSVETYQTSLDLVERRYRRGLSTLLAVRQARRTLADAEAGEPALVQELGGIQQQIAVLAGEYPKTSAAREHVVDYYRPLASVPAGLPSDLLQKRPDVRAAEARLMALNARVGAAKASRFPRIRLTAGFGYASDELGSIFKPESELWNLALGIVQPLYDGGKLKAGQDAAEAQYAQGMAEYAKTILIAFSEVENALLTGRQQRERRKRLLRFLEEAKATQEVAESRYQHGLTDYLTVLEAQQTRYVAEDRLVFVDLAIYTNRVQLYRSLGGDWGEVEPATESGKK